MEIAARAEPAGAVRRWLSFFGGLMLFALFAGFFASGYSPPGACGEVLRHNQANDIDASPLFYSDLENMRELEAGLRELRERSRLQERSRIRSGSGTSRQP